MVFRRTRENFAKQYNKLKHNTTLIERNVRESVHTGLEMIDNLEKDTKEAYNKTSNTLNKNPYYKTVRKFVSRKSNKNFTKKRKFGKKRRGGTSKRSRSRSRSPDLPWDDDDYYTPSKKTKPKYTPMRDAGFIELDKIKPYFDQEFGKTSMSNMAFERFNELYRYGATEQIIHDFIHDYKQTNIHPSKPI